MIGSPFHDAPAQPIRHIENFDGTINKNNEADGVPVRLVLKFARSARMN
jgi:hypothetical protein